MEPIVVGKHCIVSIMPEVPCVCIKWVGLPDSVEFRNGCNTALDLLALNSMSKVITDNTEASVFSMSDQRWLNENWLPRAEKLGYQYSASVVGNNDAFIKFAVNNISAKRDMLKFKSRIFTNIEEAKIWLQSL